MDYEELKLNFCNLLCQISINDLEQFMKWIDKHIQGYNKYGLNYISKCNYLHVFFFFNFRLNV